jgi:glycosyltransferase involved in cell wall biosynthesis
MPEGVSVCESPMSTMDHEFRWPAGIVLQSPAYGISSVAQEARALALAFANSGFPVSLVPADSPDDSTSAVSLAVRQQLVQLAHPKLDLARSILFYAAEPTAWNLDYHGHRRIGRAAFWTDRLPARWVEPCNALDEIWVPSYFHREAFLVSGVSAEKIVVLPPGVDTELFRPGCSPLPIPHRRGFTFLAITDPHDRKGMSLLLRAFLQEFKACDDVSLLLKLTPQEDSPMDLEAELAFFIEREVGLTLENSPVILLLDDCLPLSAMPSLYAAADAFVMPVRGQAWGKTLLEALACELPVIATRWGGVAELLNDANAYLVEIEGLNPVLARDGFLAEHRWANPSVDHLRQLMRMVSSHPEEARHRARKGRAEVVANRDWNALLPVWRQHCQRLLG